MEEFLEVMQAAVERMLEKVSGIAFISDISRISIIAFGSQAETKLPLCDVGLQLQVLPKFECMGGTNYLPVLQELFCRIDEDVASLKHAKYTVIRPCVYFLTDGNPFDKEELWIQKRQELLNQWWHPNIVAYGFGDAQEATLRELATKGRKGDTLAFIQEKAQETSLEAADLGTKFVQMFETLTQSIIGTGYSVAAGEAPPEIPEIKGFRQIDMDVI
jgi:uncharacterized protein YegL